MISSRTWKYYKLVWIKYDFASGLSVFLVALPLCLGIALASGAPLISGLISGIIGGLMVSLISGSSLAVSGPAAGLSTLVYSAIISLHGFDHFLASVCIAGVFQCLLGICKVGSIGKYFPSSVIKGMLAAIGIILISKQIPVALGSQAAHFWSSEWLNALHSPETRDNSFSLGAVCISLSCFIGYAVYKLPKFPKYKLMPVAFFMVIIGIGIHQILIHFFPAYQLKPQQLVQIPSIQSIKVFSLWSNHNILLQTEVWRFGLLIGALATLETLLCTEAMDKLDKQNRITPVNRELIAQGIGNLTCGLLGALPITAVVVRGAANIEAGARTKLSSFTHGLLLFITILTIPQLLNYIPYASLACILLITGYSLCRPSLFKNMYKLGLKQFLPFIITILIILSTDLLIGVSIGLLISIYFIIQNNFKAEYKIQEIDINHQKRFYIKLNSNVTFLNKVNLQKTLDKIPENSELTIDGKDCNFIDYDILEIISEYTRKAELKQISLHLEGIEVVETLASH